MLNNFKSIYNRELKRNFYTEFEREMLGSKHFRMFVCEVCKDCLKDEQKNLQQKDATDSISDSMSYICPNCQSIHRMQSEAETCCR